MITLVDYGLGNLTAFENLFRRLNIPVERARDANGLFSAKKLILPGVGAFDHAMERLDASGLRPELEEAVLGRGVPILGVCVGAQILLEKSEEGVLSGLGWIKGYVRSFKGNSASSNLPLPHMGWNDVVPTVDHKLFRGLEVDSRFYFLHSYYLECQNALDISATSKYGFEFSAAIFNKNIYGVQFHPEKSHHFGTQLLKNFAEL